MNYYAIPGLIRSEVPVSRIRRVIEIVSAHFGITPAYLMGKGRTNDRVLPRHIAMYILYEKKVATLKTIGRYMGFDHTTVINAAKTVARIKSVDTDYRRLVEEVEAFCSAPA